MLGVGGVLKLRMMIIKIIRNRKEVSERNSIETLSSQLKTTTVSHRKYSV